MNCVVTAGPTYEPLDEARRLTNLSTGRLGSELATCLAAQGHEVVLLLGSGATFRTPSRASRTLEFTTPADLAARLAALASGPVDAVFHAAAVSDFGFGRVFERDAGGGLVERTDRKIPTSVSNLLVELRPTPKVIAQLRGWFPSARLVGWKYEVDGDPASVIAKGLDQIARNRTDACVVNGPAYGAGFGWVTPAAGCRHWADAPALYAALGAWLAGECAG